MLSGGDVRPLPRQQKSFPESSRLSAAPFPGRSREGWRDAEQVDADELRVSPVSRSAKDFRSESPCTDVNSLSSEEVMEQWGFSHSGTALLMLKRAQKMKSNNLQRKEEPRVQVGLADANFPMTRNRGTEHGRNPGRVGKAELGRKERAQQRLHARTLLWGPGSEGVWPDIQGESPNGGRAPLPRFSRPAPETQQPSSPKCSVSCKPGPEREPGGSAGSREGAGRFGRVQRGSREVGPGTEREPGGLAGSREGAGRFGRVQRGSREVGPGTEREPGGLAGSREGAGRLGPVQRGSREVRPGPEREPGGRARSREGAGRFGRGQRGSREVGPGPEREPGGSAGDREGAGRSGPVQRGSREVRPGPEREPGRWARSREGAGRLGRVQSAVETGRIRQTCTPAKEVASAPSKKERTSFRDDPVRLSGGWGGGRKKTK
ncbi:hypothetical protein fugu_011394 [Takifugu bimaculatus]|uniref:Uncharacterized protein n=1 Tax=Takifugu bimaculatus TaxID=433685 RepID=A0A4Z2C7H9_9TELE|nr:hypothetical protein fugu_011394 [Takifugu bimaculatus]